MSAVLGVVLLGVGIALACDNIVILYLAMCEEEEKHGAIVVDPLKKKGGKGKKRCASSANR